MSTGAAWTVLRSVTRWSPVLDNRNGASGAPDCSAGKKVVEHGLGEIQELVRLPMERRKFPPVHAKNLIRSLEAGIWQSGAAPICSRGAALPG